MNILIDLVPESVEIDRTEYKIRTDFTTDRYSIRVKTDYLRKSYFCSHNLEFLDSIPNWSKIIIKHLQK